MGPIDTLHVEVDGDQALATLAHPITELVVCKLKDGVDFKQAPVQSPVDAIVDALLGCSDDIVHPPSTYVRKVDLPKAACIAVGWDTPQVCVFEDRPVDVGHKLTRTNAGSTPAELLQEGLSCKGILPSEIQPDRRAHPGPHPLHAV